MIGTSLILSNHVPARKILSRATMSVPAPVDKRKNIELHQLTSLMDLIFFSHSARSFIALKTYFWWRCVRTQGHDVFKARAVGWGKYPGAIFHEVRADAIRHH